MSLVSHQFTQSFIQAQIKENIKAPRYWPSCGEFTGAGEFPAQRASNAGDVSIWWRHHDMAAMSTTSVIIGKAYTIQERIVPIINVQFYNMKTVT